MSKRKQALLISILLIVQIAVYIVMGMNKSYIHMDEAYSLGLAGAYDGVEIQDDENFYNRWHSKEYYEDYLALGEDERDDIYLVYENQKNDVHPPVYYFLLRLAMGFGDGHFSKWPGIILNMILHCFVTLFIYLISVKMLSGEERREYKAALLTLFASLTVATFCNVIYIRMYQLAALNVLIITYLHIKLYESDRIRPKLLIAIGAAVLVGFLTHYYYLFYLVGVYAVMAVKYMREKRFRELIFYTLTMLLSGLVSLLIFPYSIQHMFFGYRGQGAISKLLDIGGFISCIGQYLFKIMKDIFAYLLPVILAVIAALIAVKRRKRNREETGIKKYGILVGIPCAVYFFFTAVSSPWIELRYIMPVCDLIFIFTIFCLYKLARALLKEKKAAIISLLLLVCILLSPAVFKIEIESMFYDKKEITERLEGELNLPTLYIFNSKENRFLDDILLFSKLDESYVAKDMVPTKESFSEIIKGKDVSSGMIVFINHGYHNENALKELMEAAGLETVTHLKRMNACDIYLVK